MRDDHKSPTWQQRLNDEGCPVSLLNEPIDFDVDFAVEPKRESATARAMRIWFKQDPDESSAP